MSGEKICFVISEIGEIYSATRKVNDEKLNLIFEPILEELGYQCIRVDKEPTANQISRDIIKRLIESIKRLIESELVIADISDKNPNVFYELAIRNSVNKPVIIVKNIGQKPRFDVADKRAIDVNMNDNIQWTNAKKQLKDVIINSQKDPLSASESIVTEFSNLFTLQNISNKKIDKTAELMIDIKDIKDQLSDLYELKDEISNLADKFTKPSPSKVESQSLFEYFRFSTNKTDYKTDDIVYLSIADVPSSYTLSTPINYSILDSNDSIVQSGYIVSNNFPLWKIPPSSTRGDYAIFIKDIRKEHVINFKVV